MSDTESDEDLKRAIALSLSEQALSPSTHKAVVVDLISSDEDDDLGAPVTARKITSTKASSNKDDEKSTEASTANSEKLARATSGYASSQKATIHGEIKPRPEEGNGSLSGPPTTVSFLGLDRKQMEEERLLRAQQRQKADEQFSKLEADARKRKASMSPSHPRGEGARQVKAKFSESATALSNPQLAAAAISTLPILSFKDQERALRAPGVQFPDGVVKKTWVHGCPRQDDIKIEEVLQKDDLELAVLSSFQIDPEWIASKLHPATKVVFVLQAKTELEVGLLVSIALFLYFVVQAATPREEHECA